MCWPSIRLCELWIITVKPSCVVFTEGLLDSDSYVLLTFNAVVMSAGSLFGMDWWWICCSLFVSWCVVQQCMLCYHTCLRFCCCSPSISMFDVCWSSFLVYSISVDLSFCPWFDLWRTWGIYSILSKYFGQVCAVMVISRCLICGFLLMLFFYILLPYTLQTSDNSDTWRCRLHYWILSCTGHFTTLGVPDLMEPSDSFRNSLKFVIRDLGLQCLVVVVGYCSGHWPSPIISST